MVEHHGVRGNIGLFEKVQGCADNYVKTKIL